MASSGWGESVVGGLATEEGADRAGVFGGAVGEFLVDEGGGEERGLRVRGPGFRRCGWNKEAEASGEVEVGGLVGGPGKAGEDGGAGFAGELGGGGGFA